MGEFLIDGPKADLSTTVVHVDGKDANLTPFKTLIQDLHIEMAKKMQNEFLSRPHFKTITYV